MSSLEVVWTVPHQPAQVVRSPAATSDSGYLKWQSLAQTAVTPDSGQPRRLPSKAAGTPGGCHLRQRAPQTVGTSRRLPPEAAGTSALVAGDLHTAYVITIRFILHRGWFVS